jgi:carboxylesterase
MALGVIAIALAAGVWWWRARHLRTMAQLTMRRRRLGPDGVAAGAEGFVLEAIGAPAVLLLHGAGDTPQTLRYLGTELRRRGFHVSAPLLPGHGRSLREFSRVTADQLYDAAHDVYADLRRAHEWTGVIGISMGGALAVQLAGETSDLPALGLVAPYLAMPPRIALAARLAWLWGVFVPVVRSSEGLSILDPNEQERNLAYGVFTAAGLRALYTTMQRAVAVLPNVTAPTLLVQSRDDNRISVADAERAFASIGAREKRLDWITGAAHIITVDFGHAKVIASLASWMQAHGPTVDTPDAHE